MRRAALGRVRRGAGLLRAPVGVPSALVIARVAVAALALLARPALACPYCGIGGRDTWSFILVVVGSFIAGAAMVLMWAWRSGQFEAPDQTSARVLELDRITGVRR